MVKRVQEDESAPESQTADNSEVDLESGAVGYGLLLAHEAGELLFELLVNIKGSVEETAAGATRTVFFDRCYCGFFKARIVGKSEVGVGAEHQYFRPVGHCDQGILT